MAELVLLNEVDPNTFLHYGVQGDSVCLRDFSRGSNVPPIGHRQYSRSEVERMLMLPGNLRVEGPRLPIDQREDWYQFTVAENNRLGLSGNTEPGQFTRLIDVFQAEVGPLLTAGDEAGLSAALKRWEGAFVSVPERVVLNPYDITNSTGLKPLTHGLGWTAAMLEHSRQGGLLQPVCAGQEFLDFSLVGMSVQFSLPAAANTYVPGRIGGVQLDGLGVRADGSFCILEVKAVNDVPAVYQATVQDLCGSVAVYAKRQMIVDIVARGNGLRPAVPKARIDNEAPSLGLYVLIDSKHVPNFEDATLERQLQLMLRAFPPLREIAYFAVDPQAVDFPALIPVGKVFTRA